MAATVTYDPAAIRNSMKKRMDVRPMSGMIFWESPPKNHPRLKGRIAGRPIEQHTGKFYVHIKINRRAFRRSWLIFLWVHGRWPKHCLDHIDGNSMNDRFNNLREATVTQNAWNHKSRAKKSPLPMGVRLIRKSGRYQARIAVDKMHLSLGAYDTADEARKVYLAKRKEFYHEFA